MQQVHLACNICTFYLLQVSAISKRSSATPESALEAANPWSVQHHHPLPTKRTFLLINFYKIDKIQFFVFRFLSGQWIIKWIGFDCFHFALDFVIYIWFYFRCIRYTPMLNNSFRCINNCLKTPNIWVSMQILKWNFNIPESCYVSLVIWVPIFRKHLKI